MGLNKFISDLKLFQSVHKSLRSDWLGLIHFLGKMLHNQDKIEDHLRNLLQQMTTEKLASFSVDGLFTMVRRDNFYP